jgi:multiple sugar transport system permease protein
MSFFSPITDRSRPARLLYLGVYLMLLAGAVSMIVPLVVTVAGSMSGPNERDTITFFPRFLLSEKAFWSRYVDARYGGSIDNVRMAWGENSVDFSEVSPPPAEDPHLVSMWKEFCAEQGTLSPRQAGLAFTRPNLQDPALENTRFRNWLLAQYGGSLARLNEELLIEVPRATKIIPPIQNRIVLAESPRPFLGAFRSYLESVRFEARMPWDVGGFYRGVFLPRIYGEIAAYNAACGTRYGAFREVPFPATCPEMGAEPWLRFVRQLLNPDFIVLTPEGTDAQKASGLTRQAYIRSQAQPAEISVESIDREFAAWAAKRGIADARIPQASMDWRDFQKDKGFWRWQFASQNFRYVLEEVLIQGNGVRNTVILVILSIVGALTVNPMAAYALSRFKLPQTYQILLFFLATIAFPAEVAMIPSFLQVKELGLINTFGALVIPGLVNGFSIFLLKGFFDSLPKELYEAADIDGASEWQIFWGITMNLSRPILAVIALGTFTSAYGAFMFALILAPDPSMWTLMVWIYQLQQNAGPSVTYASILITAVPTVLVYLFAQNMIMRGIVVPTDK